MTPQEAGAGAPRHEGTRLLWLIGRAYRLSRRSTERIARAHGITMAQLDLLMTLAEEPRLSGIDVADRTRTSPQAAHAALTALERKRLVVPVPGAEGRRVVRTELSEEGARILETCLDDLRDLGIELAERLPVEARRTLIELMHDFVTANEPPTR